MKVREFRSTLSDCLLRLEKGEVIDVGGLKLCVHGTQETVYIEPKCAECGGKVEIPTFCQPCFKKLHNQTFPVIQGNPEPIPLCAEPPGEIFKAEFDVCEICGRSMECRVQRGDNAEWHKVCCSCYSKGNDKMRKIWIKMPKKPLYD